MSYLDRIRFTLDDLARRSLLRELRTAPPAGAIDFASNDYLALARHPEVVAAWGRATRVGSGGARLLSGAHPEHAALETEIAAWTGRERALLFSSGYLAAIGAIVALAPFAEHAYSDARNHACTIDALRLTKLSRSVHAHDSLPPTSQRRTPALIVTESLFGMSGTRVAIGERVASLGRDDILVVDEAHALGVVGIRGAGLCAGHQDPRVIVIGTLSKALGGAGGFVAGPADAIAYLSTAARTFIYDTAPPPGLASALRVALAIVCSDEGERRRARIGEHAQSLVALLADAGIAALPTQGPIVPIVIGEAAEALAIGRALETRGIYAPAIRPPTVPAAQAQLRVTLRSDHTSSDLRAFVAALIAARARPR